MWARGGGQVRRLRVAVGWGVTGGANSWRPREGSKWWDVMKGWGVSAGLAVGLFAMSAQAVETVRLTMSSSHPTAVAWVCALKTHVIDNSNRRLAEMVSDYRIDWTEAYGGAIYEFNDTIEAVEDAMTELSWVGSRWEADQHPPQKI